MFEKSVDVKELLKEIDEKKARIKVLEESNEVYRIANEKFVRLLDFEREKQKFEIDKAVFEKAKSMEKVLIESDLKRVEAIAKLNTYVEMDTKEERKAITKMLEEAVKGLANSKVSN